MSEHQGERIAKILARRGLCSRREAERWIAEGRVAVGGTVLTSPAFNVADESIVTVDGKAMPNAERTRLWRYHKPAGMITAARDPQGRPTVFDNLPPGLPRVISVGRLDYNSEGLLLLTNDGALARKLELPATGWTRRYRVRVHGTPDKDALARLKNGIEVDGVRYGPIEAEMDRQQGSNAWLSVGLVEGKNREIRKVMDKLGLTVTRLIRISYGPFQLGNLPKAMVDELPGRVIAEQTGDGPARPILTLKPKPRTGPKLKPRPKKNADRRRKT